MYVCLSLPPPQAGPEDDDDGGGGGGGKRRGQPQIGRDSRRRRLAGAVVDDERNRRALAPALMRLYHDVHAIAGRVSCAAVFTCPPSGRCHRYSGQPVKKCATSPSLLSRLDIDSGPDAGFDKVTRWGVK